MLLKGSWKNSYDPLRWNLDVLLIPYFRLSHARISESIHVFTNSSKNSNIQKTYVYHIPYLDPLQDTFLKIRYNIIMDERGFHFLLSNTGAKLCWYIRISYCINWWSGS